MKKTITFYNKDNEKISSQIFIGEKYIMQDGSLNDEHLDMINNLGVAIITTPEGTHRVEVK